MSIPNLHEGCKYASDCAEYLTKAGACCGHVSINSGLDNLAGDQSPLLCLPGGS